MADQEKPRSFYGESDEDVDCPICLEPMPLEPSWKEKRDRMFMSCCGNFYCQKCCNDFTHRRTIIENLLGTLMRDPFSDPVRIQELKKQREVLLKCPLCRGKIPTTEEEIFKYTLRLAQSGNKMAQHSLISLYAAGEGVELDNSKAFFWCKKAAHGGVVAAMCSYGMMLERGIGCKKSQSESNSWILKAAEAGFPPAQHQRGLHLMKKDSSNDDRKKAFQLFKLSSEKGFDKSHAHLGYCYMHGFGVEKDIEKALALLKIGAEAGQYFAQYHLGVWSIENGNIGEGVHMLLESAKQDYPPALLHLGKFFASDPLDQNNAVNGKVEGNGNLPVVIKLLRKAEARGQKGAAEYVAEIEKTWSSKCASCCRMEPENGKLLKCSRCKLMHYCSKKCQKMHWKNGHKEDCC